MPSQAFIFVVVQCNIPGEVVPYCHVPSFGVPQCNVTSAVVSLTNVPICCVPYDALCLVSVSTKVFLADLAI